MSSDGEILDVIVALSDSQISMIQDLKAEIDRRRVGDGVSLIIVRGTKKGKIDLLIEGSP